jgi:hypothetical protein
MQLQSAFNSKMDATSAMSASFMREFNMDNRVATLCIVTMVCLMGAIIYWARKGRQPQEPHIEGDDMVRNTEGLEVGTQTEGDDTTPPTETPTKLTKQIMEWHMRVLTDELHLLEERLDEQNSIRERYVGEEIEVMQHAVMRNVDHQYGTMQSIAASLDCLQDTIEGIDRALRRLGGSEVQHFSLAIPPPVIVTDQAGLQYKYPPPTCMRPTEGPTGQSTTKSQQAAELTGMSVGALKKHAKGGGGPNKACGKPSTPN